MKKRNFLLNTLFFILLAVYVLSSVKNAAITDEDQETQKRDFSSGTLSVDDYKSSGAYPSILRNTVTDYSLIDWTIAEKHQDQIPADHIKDIPPERVDVSKVQDQSKLTKEQLSFDNNLNKVNDWSKLNTVARDSVISEKIGRSVKLDGGDQPFKGTIKDTTVTLDRGYQLEYDGELLIFGFKNAIITPEGVKAESGTRQALSNGGNVISTKEFENLEYNKNKKTITFDSATIINTRNGDIQGAGKTTIKIDGTTTTIKSEEPQTYNYQEKGSTSKVEVKAQKDSTLETSQNNIKGVNVELSFAKKFRFTPTSTDVVEAHSIDCKNCERTTISEGACWKLHDDSSYMYILPTTVMTFKTPDSLCIVEEPYSCNDCSVFNTNDKTIMTTSALLTMEKKSNGYDTYSARTSGDAFYTLSEDFFLIKTVDLTKATFDASTSKYVHLKKNSNEWLLKVNNAKPPILEQVETITDGKTTIQFFSGELRATDSARTTTLHRPEKVPPLPEALIAIPLLLPALFLIPRRAQTTLFIILALIIILIGLLFISQSTISGILKTNNPIDDFARSCLDSGIERLDKTIAKQGAVPLTNSDGYLNISLLLNTTTITQQSFDSAIVAQEQALERLFKNCVSDYQAVSGVVRAVHAPTARIQRLDTRSTYEVNANALITLADGTEHKIGILSTTTTYPYKKFHEQANTTIQTIKSTGYQQLFTEKNVTIWTARGTTYTRLQDEEGNTYQYAVRTDE